MYVHHRDSALSLLGRISLIVIYCVAERKWDIAGESPDKLPSSLNEGYYFMLHNFGPRTGLSDLTSCIHTIASNKTANSNLQSPKSLMKQVASDVAGCVIFLCDAGARFYSSLSPPQSIEGK